MEDFFKAACNKIAKSRCDQRLIWVDRLLQNLYLFLTRILSIIMDHHGKYLIWLTIFSQRAIISLGVCKLFYIHCRVWFIPVVSRKAAQNAKQMKPSGRWAASGFHSAQPRREIWGDIWRLEKCCLVWWISIFSAIAK